MRKVVVNWRKVTAIGHLETDEHGVVRFRSGIGHYLVDMQNVDLNLLWIAHASKKLTDEDLLRFYMTMGYSLDGFYDVFSRVRVTDFKTGKVL